MTFRCKKCYAFASSGDASKLARDAGVQKCCDLFLVALAQSEGFGEARIRRVCEAVRALEREYGKAWRNEPESDWAQEQIDRVLRGVCEAGRKAFARDHGLSLDGEMTREEFFELTKDAYGGETIRRAMEAAKNE